VTDDEDDGDDKDGDRAERTPNCSSGTTITEERAEGSGTPTPVRPPSSRWFFFSPTAVAAMLVFYSLARSLAADLPVTRVLQCVSNVYAPQCTASTAANGGVSLSLSLSRARARVHSHIRAQQTSHTPRHLSAAFSRGTFR